MSAAAMVTVGVLVIVGLVAVAWNDVRERQKEILAAFDRLQTAWSKPVRSSYPPEQV